MRALCTAKNAKLATLIKTYCTSKEIEVDFLDRNNLDLSKSDSLNKLDILSKNYDIIFHLASSFNKNKRENFSIKELKESFMVDVLSSIILSKNKGVLVIFNSNNIEREINKRYTYGLAKLSLDNIIKYLGDNLIYLKIKEIKTDQDKEELLKLMIEKIDEKIRKIES